MDSKLLLVILLFLYGAIGVLPQRFSFLGLGGPPPDSNSTQSEPGQSGLGGLLFEIAGGQRPSTGPEPPVIGGERPGSGGFGRPEPAPGSATETPVVPPGYPGVPETAPGPVGRPGQGPGQTPQPAEFAPESGRAPGSTGEEIRPGPVVSREESSEPTPSTIAEPEPVPIEDAKETPDQTIGTFQEETSASAVDTGLATTEQDETTPVEGSTEGDVQENVAPNEASEVPQETNPIDRPGEDPAVSQESDTGVAATEQDGTTPVETSTEGGVQEDDAPSENSEIAQPTNPIDGSGEDLTASQASGNVPDVLPKETPVPEQIPKEVPEGADEGQEDTATPIPQIPKPEDPNGTSTDSGEQAQGEARVPPTDTPQEEGRTSTSSGSAKEPADESGGNKENGGVETSPQSEGQTGTPGPQEPLEPSTEPGNTSVPPENGAQEPSPEPDNKAGPPQGETQEPSTESGNKAPAGDISGPSTEMGDRPASPQEEPSGPSTEMGDRPASPQEEPSGPSTEMGDRPASPREEPSGPSTEMGDREDSPQQETEPQSEDNASPEPEDEAEGPSQEKEEEIIATGVFSAVEQSNITEVVILLDSSENVEALAEGFTFTEEVREEVLKKTPERVEDGDVVTIKSIATALLANSSSAEKLARVMVLSVFPEGNDTLVAEIKELFEDEELVQEVVDADPTRDLLPSFDRRRLTCDACSPVNAFTCAHCWTATICSKFYWCPPAPKKKKCDGDSDCQKGSS